MSSLYPERIASYFASMNPLSAKIIADIQCVEESVKIDNNLSYSEKSKIIDKHLIFDVIRRNKEKYHNGGEHNKEAEEEEVPASEIYYDDPELDQDHVSALVTSVYPKRPEKYVFDDNSFYIDEHSEPFSYCTQSQAQYCELGKLFMALPQPPSLTSKLDSKSRAGSHHHHYHHREKKIAPLPTQRLSTEVSNPDVSTVEADSVTTIAPESSNKKPKKAGITALGVPLMGLSSAILPSSKSTEKKHNTKNSNGNSQNPPANESNLPNQVPNSDLIAELQAKLKMNKEKGKGTGLKHTSFKVNKPRAPPPPPPKQSPEVKVAPESESSKDRRKGPSTAVTTTIPDVHSSCSTKKATAPTTPTEVELNTKDPKDEFCVDVSSPCRIATPKTGFDFLDNW